MQAAMILIKIITKMENNSKYDRSDMRTAWMTVKIVWLNIDLGNSPGLFLQIANE